ncbi:MAG: hypothetical protein QOF30_1740 [Acidimicrobiaceae bacterium]|jgi:hypothetical protein|nr:hypothetical protein [Acidimicrobiaceae bacterium]
MRLVARPFVVVTVIVVALLAGGSAAAGANEVIRPDEHFIGLVNGSNVQAVVYTLCPGPLWPGRTGPVASGQNLAVARVGAGHGFTGLFSQVYAWFVQDSSASAPDQVKLAKYGTQRQVPSSVRVPCDGTGRVEFSSCPYLAPCAFGWVPNFVGVRFVNLAA